MASIAKRRWTYKGEEKIAWVVRYIDQAGKQRLLTCGSNKEAKAERTRIESELASRVHTPDSDTMTMAETTAAFLVECDRRFRDKDRMTQGTLTQFRGVVRNHIDPFIGTLKLSRFTAAQAQQWIDQLRRHDTQPRTAWTIRVAMQVLRQAIAEAQRRGCVSRNVMVDATPRRQALPDKRIDIPAKPEIRRLLGLAQVRQSSMVRRDEIPIGLIVEVAMLTGMRVGEILSLQWEYVLFSERVVRVRHSTDRWRNMNKPKSQAGNRDIPLPPGLLARLAEWKLRRPSARFVFPTTSGGVLTNANLQRYHWKSLRKEAGLDAEARGTSVRFHDLRHIAASLFIEQGLPPKRVMYLMGHSSIQITFDRYGHLFPGDDAAQVASAAIEAELLAGLQNDKAMTNGAQVIELIR